MNTDTASLKELLRRELPGWLRTDPEFRAYILELTRQEYAGRAETEDRFQQVLAELRHDREEQARKWDEQARRWDEQDKRWHEQNAQLKEQWAEQNRKWDENNEKWRDQARRWEESDRRFAQTHQEIMAQAKKFDRSIGALGARWGLRSEQAFRDALAGILEESFGVQVIRVNEFDDQGVVFGRPDQVELDVIIHNGLLLICELKSSMGKAAMYAFERKARFYEQRHGRTANRLLVISPMIDARALEVAARLGIEIYGDSSEVAAL